MSQSLRYKARLWNNVMLTKSFSSLSGTVESLSISSRGINPKSVGAFNSDRLEEWRAMNVTKELFAS